MIAVIIDIHAIISRTLTGETIIGNHIKHQIHNSIDYPPDPPLDTFENIALFISEY